MNTPTPFIGPPPENCDLCGRFIALEFIDGATKLGPWGYLCPGCHTRHGYGLGTGKGQRYTRLTIADKFTKMEG